MLLMNAAPLASLFEGGGELASRRECRSRDGTGFLIFEGLYLYSQDTPSASLFSQFPQRGSQWAAAFGTLSLRTGDTPSVRFASSSPRGGAKGEYKNSH